MQVQNESLHKLFNAPQVKIVRPEHLRVPCPYCQVGGATLEMVASIDGMRKEIHGMNDKHKCSSCSKYFGVKPITNIVGVPLEDQNPTVGEIKLPG